MAQLWGGRFTKQTDEAVKAFNDSIGFDKRLYREDIEGSIAHAGMLGAQGIITPQEADLVISGLGKILADVESGELTIGSEYEDIHSFVEANLIERIGDAGKKLHTGRSRNDQVALDMKLYTRRKTREIREHLCTLLETILGLMEENTDTYMPGFTHLQKAQPTSLAHHLGAYFEMFKRDAGRLDDCLERMNYCPLGSGALAGTTYPLDRYMTAEKLGFAGPTLNSMVEMDDAFSTGSSIMPQKKNPDICELVRGKTGRVYGDLMSLLTTMKGLPLAYNKDMQEDKEPAFDAIDTAEACISLFSGMLSTITFRKDVMRLSAVRGFTNATDAADYLVVKGVPFRDAHGIIGRLVLHCIDENKSIEDLSLSELKQFSPAFEEDIYEAVSLRTCVEKRLTLGAPGSDMMKTVIGKEKEWLEGWHRSIEVS